MVPFIDGELKKVLLRHTLNALPNEAVGVIHKSVVYLLRNQSSSPESSFEFDVAALRRLVSMLQIPEEKIDEEVILWHSHPAGGVGPSREDMRNRTPLKHHLVVSLVKGDIVPTWY